MSESLDLIVQTAIATIPDGPVHKAFAGWIAETMTQSGSPRTLKTYTDTFTAYRDRVLDDGGDLFTLPAPTLRTIATEYAMSRSEKSKRTGQVAAATIAQRYAILSSFYNYAVKNDYCAKNPIDAIKRGKVKAYANAQPIKNAGELISSIDRSTLAGKRDYALLLILVSTGRRASEVARLTWKDITIEASTITIKLKAKGNEDVSDTLDARASEALAAYIAVAYPGNVLRADDPLWVSVSHNPKGKGHAPTGLSTQAIADICKKRLGVSKIHATRHTFAKTMEKAGAPLSAIQRRLNHKNAATTSIYLSELGSADNPYVGAMLDTLGIK